MCGAVLLAGCQGMQQSGSSGALSGVSVVNQLQLDSVLYGHNMLVSGCFAYVTMQNGLSASKLAVANVCGIGTGYSATPVLVGEVAGSFPVMNGIAANGNYLYVTYGWVTNPLEVWNVGIGAALPNPMGCVSLFNNYGYTSCSAAATGYGSLYGQNPYVFEDYAYIAENSDDSGQAVQVVDVGVPTLPVKVNAPPLGITAGTGLAGLWAAGSGHLLYVGTVHSSASSTVPVTITAYDASVNPVNPPAASAALNIPAGYSIQAMSVTGSTVVATLYNQTTSNWQVMAASFANPAAPTSATVAATSGCGFESQNFIALQGSYAFMGCGMGKGIEVVNFGNLAAPVVTGQIATSLTGVGFISPQGRYLYAVDQNGELDTIDAGTTFQ